MSRKAQSLVLNKSQAACLIALRNGKVSKPEIAIHGKLDLIKTASALRALARFGLAKQDRAKRWLRLQVEKSVASRSSQINCGETPSLRVPADGGCSNYWISRCEGTRSPKS